MQVGTANGLPRPRFYYLKCGKSIVVLYIGLILACVFKTLCLGVTSEFALGSEARLINRTAR